MKIILVEWKDSSSITGWHRLGKDDSISREITVGVLCKEDNESITMFQSKGLDTGCVDNTFSIPKGCIKRIRPLFILQGGKK